MKSKYVVLVIGVVLAAVVVSSLMLIYLPKLMHPTLPALTFNGSSRVEIPSAEDLEFGQRPFSVSLWFRTVTAQPNITFITKRTSALGDGWGIFGQGDNQFLFYAAGCASPMSSPQNYRDGQWHHLAVVRHDSSVDIFYDAQHVGSGPENCNFLDHYPILIGMDGERGQHFQGDLGEVQIYSRALAQDEIAGEWNNGDRRRASEARPGLVAGYRFDEGSGTVARDYSGAGHDGALVNSPVRTQNLR